MPSRFTSCVVLAAFLPLALNLGGCGSTGQNAAAHVLKTPELPTDTQTKCKVAKSQSEPLIVEWPDAARGRLESVSRRGLVAVRYEGCELSVLPRCTVKTQSPTYAYSPITRKQSKVTIKDADELYASMPVGAVKLEGKLQSKGQLDVAMTIVGRYESTSTNVFREELEGDCADATHVIAALTVGSFTFSAGADAEVGGSASAIIGGGGGKSTAQRETLQHDGDEAACSRATIADRAPPEGCGALLQIEVMPLAKGRKPAPVVAVVPPPPPPPVAIVEPPASTASAASTSTAKPPRCKKGERIENNVCVKPGSKTAAAKPKPGAATAGIAAASVTCAFGQHAVGGRCVDDEQPVQPSPEPAPPPEPAPAPIASCLPGSHLQNGACVVDPMRETTTPDAYTLPANAGQPGEHPNPWRTVLMYVAVAGGASATGFGLAALSAAGKVNDGCNAEAKTCTQEAADARDKAKTYGIITDVSLGVLIASVVGVILLPSKVKVGAAPTPRGVAASAWWQF